MGGPYQRLTIGIDGLACGGALSVERAIARLPGVIRVYVNPLTEMAYVEIDPTRVSEEQIVAAVTGLGLTPGRSMVR
jgi:copper chaperone CopZ